MWASPGPVWASPGLRCSGRGWELLGRGERPGKSRCPEGRRPQGSTKLSGEKNVTWSATSSGHRFLLSHPKQAPADVARALGPGQQLWLVFHLGSEVRVLWGPQALVSRGRPNTHPVVPQSTEPRERGEWPGWHVLIVSPISPFGETGQPDAVSRLVTGQAPIPSGWNEGVPRGTDLLEPTGPFPSPATSPEGTHGDSTASPVLITSLLSLDVRFLWKLQLGAMRAPDPQMPPAADRLQPAQQFLLSPPWLHRRVTVPLRQGGGSFNHRTTRCMRSPLRDFRTPTEQPLGSTESQRFPGGPHPATHQHPAALGTRGPSPGPTRPQSTISHEPL